MKLMMARIMKKKKIKAVLGSGRSLDEQKMGTEPVFDDESTSTDILNGFNWYGYFYEADQAKKWLIEYMKFVDYDKEEIRLVKTSPWGKHGVVIDGANIINLRQAGFLGRMIMRGLKNIPEDLADKLNHYIEYSKSISKVNQPKKKETSEGTYKPTIQDHIKEQVHTLCGEIEGAIDDFFDNGCKPTLKVYDWLVENEVKGLIAKKIADEFRPHLSKVNSVWTDELIYEEFSHLKKKQIELYKKFIISIIDDCDRFSSNSKVSRKPRKKKPVSVSKQIAKLNYKKQDDDYKIASVNPSEIVGADQLYVFNTKYRKLGVYKSEGPGGLSVKGSTIKGFDQEASKCKKVRKPQEVLTKILKGSKLVVRRQYESLTSVEKTLTGRINHETILLKIIK